MTVGKAIEGILVPLFAITFGFGTEPVMCREAFAAGRGGSDRCGKGYGVALEGCAGESPEGKG